MPRSPARPGQTELNKLDVVVSLKLNQLYCMDNMIEGQAAGGGEDGDKPRCDFCDVVPVRCPCDTGAS